ncbi:MAG: ribosome biogenesis GTPase YlqF [Fusobacteriaceae bacterium]|nr:ribosome biogenesis GTPase YlqF [Fusobacteriaceae bacterium]MBP6466794.1 ribosome biogenesis GTPase YlqF [Fusobacteriaceae bacterium]MBU9916988.1 ribosome biogenesis GTPase YlqF [Fusobacteriaceae bacterium]
MSMTMINWYPGHMKKTKDMIKDTIDVIDIVLEIVDARIPMSSKNPEIKRFAKNKKRLILLNKSDLVGSEELNYWKKYFIDNDFADEVVAISAEKGTNMKVLYQKIDELSKDKIAKQKAKGLLKVSIRLMVAGIPNVGKSRLINRIVGKSKAGVGNKPGFTRGKQWVRIKDGLELLDTPGILWPKFENEEVGMNLAICGAIKDEILPVEEVAATFIGRMKELKKEKIFIDNYKLKEEDFTENNLEILYNVAIRMGMLKKNGYPDTLQAAYKILREYRSGKLGLFGIEKRS